MGVQWLNLTVGGVGLAVSVALLIEAMMLRKVALGGAIADKISYFLLATLCLSAAALAAWASNFAKGVTLEQTRLAEQLLNIAAMALLVAYFYSIRSAMHRYMTSITGGEHLLQESSGLADGGDQPEDPSGDRPSDDGGA